MPDGRRLGWKSVLRVMSRVLFVSVPFVAAGTVRWERGWIWVGVTLLSMAVFARVARAKNPGILKTRLGSRWPSKPFDRAFVVLYSLAALAFFVIAGLDARWGWSYLSFGWLYAGVALHVVAMVPLGAVIATNPFLESTVRIQSERGHVAVTSGPYAIVRHPMYVGVTMGYLAWPLIFGSLWAYIPAVAVAILFVFRTAHEDRTLRLELPGYEDYARRTRYRLVPGLW